MDPQTPGQPSQTPGPQSYAPPSPAPVVASSAGAGTPDIVKRGIALFIDCVIVGFAYGIVSVAMGLVLGRFGLMAAAAAATAAMLVRDVVLGGQSVGKKVMGLAAVGADGSKVTLQQSIRRNATLAIGLAGNIIAPIPIIGLLSMLIGLAGLVAFVYEVYLVATNQPRLGDKIAGTHVISQGQAVVAL